MGNNFSRTNFGRGVIFGKIINLGRGTGPIRKGQIFAQIFNYRGYKLNNGNNGQDIKIKNIRVKTSFDHNGKGKSGRCSQGLF
jgi:hypothetical protein